LDSTSREFKGKAFYFEFRFFKLHYNTSIGTRGGHRINKVDKADLGKRLAKMREERFLGKDFLRRSFTVIDALTKELNVFNFGSGWEEAFDCADVDSVEIAFNLVDGYLGPGFAWKSKGQSD
jgi:hypothetical protein